MVSAFSVPKAKRCTRGHNSRIENLAKPRSRQLQVSHVFIAVRKRVQNRSSRPIPTTGSRILTQLRQRGKEALEFSSPRPWLLRAQKLHHERSTPLNNNKSNPRYSLGARKHDPEGWNKLGPGQYEPKSEFNKDKAPSYSYSHFNPVYMEGAGTSISGRRR